MIEGDHYRRYAWASNSNDDGGTLPLFAFHLEPGYHAGVDATLTGRGAFSNYTYFFKGGNYNRYNWTTNRVDYVGSLATGFGLPAPFSSGVTAALNGYGAYAGYAYFFKGTSWASYNWSTGAVTTGSLSSWNLPAPFNAGFDTVIQGVGAYASYAYFTSGSGYAVYNWNTNTATGGYDMTTSWTALLGVRDTPTRRIVLYTTLDCWDGHTNAPHVNARNRLQNIASSVLWNALVDDWWAPTVTASMLSNPHILALYGGGSYDEWQNYYLQTGTTCTNTYYPTYTNDWQTLLDEYKSLIVGTNVPMFMACGSHQFTAWAFKDWSAVGHITTPGGTQYLISSETTSSHIPSPRYHEVGTTAVHIEQPDTIFNGLDFTDGSMTDFFVDEEHADEVVSGGYDTGHFERVLTADTSSAVYEYQYSSGHQARSQVQMLRYSYPSSSAPDRILYTTQFHPDVDATTLPLLTDTPEGEDAEAEARDNGWTLLSNFVAKAIAFW